MSYDHILQRNNIKPRIMLYIRHRINTVKDLKTVPENMGIELDLRYKNNDLILQHDPFKDGEYFEDLLKEYKHSFIVLNIKSEGIEDETLRLLNKYNVRNYFFLDVSFPALIRLSKRGEKNVAARFSEYEPIEQCLCLKGFVNWVWVDCFNKIPDDEQSYKEIKKYFNICLVSPELHKHPTERITEFKKIVSEFNVNAICTKVPELWEQ